MCFHNERVFNSFDPWLFRMFRFLGGQRRCVHLSSWIPMVPWNTWQESEEEDASESDDDEDAHLPQNHLVLPFHYKMGMMNGNSMMNIEKYGNMVPCTGAPEITKNRNHKAGRHCKKPCQPFQLGLSDSGHSMPLGLCGEIVIGLVKDC